MSALLASALLGCTTTAPLEPPFAWDDGYSTPGTALVLEETKRGPVSTGTAVWYRLSSRGFPEGEAVLWQRRGASYLRFAAIIDGEGSVFPTAAGDKLGALIAFADVDYRSPMIIKMSSGGQALMTSGYTAGHALDLALVSGNARAQVKVFPIPNEATGPGGCRVSVEVRSETGLLFLLTLSGFDAGEEVEITSRYKSEDLVTKEAVSEEGDLRFPILFGKGDRGDATFSAAGRSCLVSLQYGVGEDALVARSTATH